MKKVGEEDVKEWEGGERKSCTRDGERIGKWIKGGRKGAIDKRERLSEGKKKEGERDGERMSGKG